MDDDIDPAFCSVNYSSFNDAISKVVDQLALVAKADIKSAFCLLPIHPSAFNSLSFYFNDCFYFDCCLPMGCSVFCCYFEVFSSFLEWSVSHVSGTDNLIHYLDDLLFIGPASSHESLYLFTIFRMLCRKFGVLLAEEKSVWPTTSLEYLGITIETLNMEFCLPPDKVNRLCFLVSFVIKKKKVTLRTLQSLLGLLAFATRVIAVGRVFSKRLYKALSGLKNPRHFVWISSDLRVWDCFSASFNGHSFWQSPFCDTSAISLFTNASGSCGYGVYWNGHWSASPWLSSWIERGLNLNIVFLEIFPILVVLELWGDQFINSKLLFHSDNKDVVFAINCMSSRSPPFIAVPRQLVLKCLCLNIWIKSKYVPGHFNDIADSLSRLQLEHFRTLVPDADLQGHQCLVQLWSLV